MSRVVMLSRLKARMLLSECRGDEIWSAQLCREQGVPEAWIEELADAFESPSITVTSVPTSSQPHTRTGASRCTTMLSPKTTGSLTSALTNDAKENRQMAAVRMTGRR